MGDAARELDLAQEPLESLCIVDDAADRLDRDVFVELFVPSRPDLAHPAQTDTAEQPEPSAQQRVGFERRREQACERLVEQAVRRVV